MTGAFSGIAPNNKAPVASGNSNGGIDQHEGNEPDMYNPTQDERKQAPATIEVTGRSPDGRERRTLMRYSRSMTADGARRLAVRLLEAAHRVDRGLPDRLGGR